MPIYRPTPRPANRGMATMIPHPSAVAQPQPTPAPTTPQIANPPSSVSLAQAPGSALMVTWTYPAVDSSHDAATGFNLLYSPSGAGNWNLVAGVTSPYLLSGLMAGEAVDVQLQSSNAAGTGAWSAISTLATGTAGPNTPTAVSLAQGAGSDLTVTWSAPAIDSTHSAATGYNLQSSPSGAGTWTILSGVVSPCDLSGLAGGAAIDVQVQASNASGTSGWSATTTLTTASTAPVLSVPNVPSGVSLAQGTGSDLTVTWTAPVVDGTHGAATGFNLQSSPSGAGTWTIVSAVTSPYDLSGLAAGAAIDVQVQALNASGSSGWSAITTLTTAATGPSAPNAPAITNVAPPPNGTTSQLTVTWTAPAVDSTHGAATGYNLRSSPTGAGTWTTVTGVTSPYTLTGLSGAAAIDIEIQATNAAASPGPWSPATTGTTWGATVVPASWSAAASQVQNTSVAPNGGVNFTAAAAPTGVTGGAFAWSVSQTTLPTTGLIAATTDGQTNGWGQWFNTPDTAGTFYLWMLAQGAGGVTTGALVTSAIVVS
jgi:Fibronectin type III domain